jgi:hypothetical protein
VKKMKKYLLLAGVAAVLASVSTNASANRGGADVDLEFSNNVDTSVVNHYYRFDLTGMFGGALIRGVIEPDSAATAITDAKQVMEHVDVRFREENELNGENGYVSAVFGPGWSEAGNDPNDSLTNGVVEGQIRVGFFAPIINTATTGAIDADGNVGVNVAAGQYNMQQNSANIAVSSNDVEDGWASASTTGYQSLKGTFYGAADDETLPEDDEESGGGGNNFRDRNTALPGEITGDGNIGVNVAAGAFNQQQNLMTLAVASNSILSQSTAALWQNAQYNDAEIQDQQNFASTGGITGAGNIGVNVAAGVGNQQQNSLTAAVAGDFGGGGEGPPDDPDDPS